MTLSSCCALAVATLKLVAFSSRQPGAAKVARSGKLFQRAVIGMALGFAYFVVDNAALAMGSFGGYPPLLAAWAPFFLFLLVGETVLVRTEE